jgi:hypothetical protein
VPGARHELVAVGHALRRVAVEDEQVGDLRDRLADPGEHRSELGIDAHGRRVAVIDDVGRLLVGESVVERHGDGTDLARGVDHLDDPDGVLSAPDDLLAGPHSETSQDVCQAVGTVFELGPRTGPDVAVPAVVDDGRCVAGGGGVAGEQVGHGDRS